MHLALVACGKSKMSTSCKAEDLYLGSLFKKSRKWAEMNADQWAILSAKHHLLRPGIVTEPYEQTLNNANSMQILEWSNQVIAQIHLQYHGLSRVTILAGSKYRRHLVPWLKSARVHVSVPMQGMGIGQQLAWLTRQGKEV